MNRCYRCGAYINLSDPTVHYLSDLGRYVHERCILALSQKQRILHYLQYQGSLTQKESIMLHGCYRLSGRILELRRVGYLIDTQYEANEGKGQHARYIYRGFTNVTRS